MKVAYLPKMLCWVGLRYSGVTIDGERKFHLEKLEKFTCCSIFICIVHVRLNFEPEV